MSKEIDPQLLQHYEVKKLLGSGAYGHVWKVVDKKDGQEKALKKIFDAFHNDVDAQRTYRQITVLHELDHPNIIKLHRVMKAKNNRDLYLLFDYMEADLHSLVGESILENMHMRYVFYQILRGLKYLHSAQLIHRDLKPSNILINSECQIKICDFGLVRSLTHEQDQQMILSQEVATRWYRSPEMLLGSKSYTKQTDVWSVGCIMAQLLIGEPLFAGESTLNQLEKILQFSGIPSKQNIDALDSQVAQTLINQLNVRRKSTKEYFRQSDPEIMKLALKMLQFNPIKRITIEQAMQQAIFQQFHNHKAHQDICYKFIVPQLDDNSRLSVNKYRQMIYCDIYRRYPSDEGSQGPEKVVVMERKKFTRSHHSFKSKKSCDQQRSCNSLYKVKKDFSASIHHPEGNQKIRKLKKEHKNLNSSLKSPHQTKVQSFHRPSRKNILAPNNESKNIHTLMKVRSRKILNRSFAKGKENSKIWAKYP